MADSDPNQVSGHLGARLKSVQKGTRFESWLGVGFCCVRQRQQVCRSLDGDGESGFVVGKVKAWQHASGFVGFQAGSNQHLGASIQSHQQGGGGGGCCNIRHPPRSCIKIARSCSSKVMMHEGIDTKGATRGMRQGMTSRGSQHGVKYGEYKGGCPKAMPQGA